jgi:hypothetical protein
MAEGRGLKRSRRGRALLRALLNGGSGDEAGSGSGDLNTQQDAQQATRARVDDALDVAAAQLDDAPVAVADGAAQAEQAEQAIDLTGSPYSPPAAAEDASATDGPFCVFGHKWGSICRIPRSRVQCLPKRAPPMQLSTSE